MHLKIFNIIEYFQANDDIVLDKVDTKQLKEQWKQDREEYRTRITTLEQDVDRLRLVLYIENKQFFYWGAAQIVCI